MVRDQRSPGTGPGTGADPGSGTGAAMLIGTARRIVVVGSVNIDLMLRCPQLPAAGETVLGKDFLQAPGGKGANQAVAAARLGAEVAFIGCIGDDPFGDQATAALCAALPGHVAMRHVAAPTEVLRQAAGHAAASRLAGAGHVIVTCGGNGAILAGKDGLLNSPAFPGHGAGHHRRTRLLRRRLGRSAGRRPSLAAGHRAGTTCGRLQRRAPRRTGSHAASRRPARLELTALTCIPKSR